jgi:hypothetical protein
VRAVLLSEIYVQLPENVFWAETGFDLTDGASNCRKRKKVHMHLRRRKKMRRGEKERHRERESTDKIGKERERQKVIYGEG